VKPLFQVLAAVGLLVACEEARWIELPPLLMTCGDLEDEELQAELANEDRFSIGRGMLQGVCVQSGAKQFAGKTRCRDDVVEIRCTS